MLFTILIPTYKRPDHLKNCLEGVAAQSRQADEVIVTVREDDTETRALLLRWEGRLPLRAVLLDRPGVIVAMNAGCSVASGDVVCLTDDDAVPRKDWLARIEEAFLSDDKIGAVGGKDLLRSGEDDPNAYTAAVGKVMSFGRVIGNHHLGIGPMREVDHLKGVNMSWRVRASGKCPFNPHLQGHGAQVYFELAFCFRLKRQGWKIIYDPAILVDHYVAVRFDEDNRTQRNVNAMKHAAYNFYVSFLREHERGWKRSAALVWARMIGTRDMPGFVREFVAFLRRDSRGLGVARATRTAWKEAKEREIAPTNERL